MKTGPVARTVRCASVLLVVASCLLYVASTRSQAASGDLDAVYQVNACGPIALYAVCYLNGIEASIEELGQLAGLDRNGTSIAGLVHASRAKGLDAKPFKSSIRHLRNVDAPAIVDYPSGHFSVLLGWKDDEAVLFDPQGFKHIVTVADLERRWGRHVIAFQSSRGGSVVSGGARQTRRKEYRP